MFQLIKRMPSFIQGPIIRNSICIDETKIKNITFKIAETLEELEQAYRLVYEVYQEIGYTDYNPSKLRLSLVNALPLTTVFIAKIDNKVIATMTIFEDSKLKLPMDKLYSKKLNNLRNKGRKIMEVGAFITHPDYRGSKQALPISLTKTMLNYSIKHLKVDDLVIMVHPKHVWVYTNIFLFEKIGNKKRYEGINNNPVTGLRIDLRTCFEKSRAIYKNKPKRNNIHYFFFHSNSAFIQLPKIERPIYIWTPEMLSYFFEQKTDIFRFAQQEHKNYIITLHHLHRELSVLAKTA